MNRACHRHTTGFDLPERRMISVVPQPSACNSCSACSRQNLASVRFIAHPFDKQFYTKRWRADDNNALSRSIGNFRGPRRIAICERPALWPDR